MISSSVSRSKPASACGRRILRRSFSSLSASFSRIDQKESSSSRRCARSACVAELSVIVARLSFRLLELISQNVARLRNTARDMVQSKLRTQTYDVGAALDFALLCSLSLPGNLFGVTIKMGARQSDPFLVLGFSLTASISSITCVDSVLREACLCASR